MGAVGVPERWMSLRRALPTLGAVVACLATLVLLGLGLFSVFQGWKLTHPVARPVVGDPGTGASLDYRCLPLDPPAFCGPKPLFTSGHPVPVSAWIVMSVLTLYPGASFGWSTNTVIMVQDQGQSRTPTGFPIWSVTRTLVDAGYNVVLFDTRGQGLSGGSGIGFGTLEVTDLMTVIQYMQDLGAPQGHIAVWGLGTGADAAILAAARTPDVSAVIADSPYLTPGAFLRRAIPTWTGLRPFPFVDGIVWAMQKETGVQYSAYDPRTAVAKLGGANPRPLLLVGGDEDTLTPYSDVQQLYVGSKDARAYPLEVRGAGHLQAFAKSPPDSDVPQASQYMCYVLNTLSAMQTPTVSARPNAGPTGPCGGVAPAVAAEAGSPPTGASGVVPITGTGGDRVPGASTPANGTPVASTTVAGPASPAAGPASATASTASTAASTATSPASTAATAGAATVPAAGGAPPAQPTVSQ